MDREDMRACICGRAPLAADGVCGGEADVERRFLSLRDCEISKTLDIAAETAPPISPDPESSPKVKPAPALFEGEPTYEESA